MKVHVSIDPQDVAEDLINNYSVEIVDFTDDVQGPLTDIIKAVIANLRFGFDRDAEIGTVTVK